jgi:cobaltochelatase CobN
MICGFFRDMFPTLVRDLDKLLRAIAALDEPADLNPLRARALAAGAEPGRAMACARIFGPRPQDYGTGIPDHINESRWAESREIGDLYHEAMGHAYGAQCCGAPAREELGNLLAATDVVSQVIEGQEYKIGDLDHYYEFLGGACRAVENLKGSRPECLVGDTARYAPRLADASDELRRCATTRLLNPAWIEGMLGHELHGAKKIEERVTNLVGLAATVGVPTALFDRVFERFVEDGDLFDRLRDNNSHAALGLARRMAEAAQRDFWSASPEQLDLLRQRHARLEAELE